MALQLLAACIQTSEANLLEPESEDLNEDQDALPALLAGIVERIFHEYPAVTLAELVTLVRRCRRDIDTGAPDDCLAELVERLARVRLDEQPAGRRPYLGRHPHQ